MGFSVNVAIFPTGLSFGNTIQCSLSFINAGEDWLCWLISTPETQSICNRIGEGNTKIKVISQDDLDAELEKLNDNMKFNFLFGPSTSETQLSTLSLLFNHSYVPTFWFIEEDMKRKTVPRFLCSYSDSKIPMSIVEENQLFSFLSDDDVEFIRLNGIEWDVKSNRFNYRVKFPSDALHFDRYQIRKFQDQILNIFQEAKNKFGEHGVLGSHQKLPDGWSIAALDRFQQGGLSGGR